MNKTRWIGPTTTAAHASDFLRKAAAYYLTRDIARLGRKLLGRTKKRTPDAVRHSYDIERSKRSVIDFDSYVFGAPEDADFFLEEDRIEWGELSRVRTRILARLLETITRETQGITRPLVVEFGSGGGRNLLYLKRMRPDLEVIGLELSPASVALAQKAAREFELDVRFQVTDVTTDLADVPAKAAICFSFHALEQMPRIFKASVRNMMQRAERAVLFYEPVAELWGRSARSRIARSRVRVMDRLQGLYAYLKSTNSKIVSAERLGMAINPLNETTEIIVRS